MRIYWTTLHLIIDWAVSEVQNSHDVLRLMHKSKVTSSLKF